MNNIQQFIKAALQEDIGEGDHTTLSCIPEDAVSKAKLLIKEDGILAGVELASEIFKYLDKSIKLNVFIEDGSAVKYGDIAFEIEASSRTILSGERLALNCMQRMSGIATLTRKFTDIADPYGVKILDTRKTTPLIRFMEKWAVRIGGGVNHRFGLYDMIMIKDNHIDYAGGIDAAIRKANDYRLSQNKASLKIEVEARNLDEVEQILATTLADRIMLDNFTVPDIEKALILIDKRTETEISGGVNLQSLEAFCATRVDYVSVGALTHSVCSMDMSLKAI